jgi:DNA-binding response OmpR family regulator
MQDGKHVILCIDDDPDILDSLKTILESRGYVFAGAPSAEDGLRAYDETNPDLIFVDLMMEEVDAGTGFVKEMKARGNSAPIYMLSSMGNALSMNINANELGLSGVFQKPVDPKTLLSLLQSKLGSA